MGILPIRELARIPARDPTGDSDLPLPRLTGPRIKSNGKSKSCFALLFASARRTRALCSSRGPHGLAAAADDQAPQGCARRIARIPLLHRMCNQRNPADDADPLGRMPKGRKALGRVSLVPFFARAKKGTRSPQASGSPCSKKQNSKNWIPAFAGMTSGRAKTMDSGLTRAILALALRAIRCANVRARSRARSRRNDEQRQRPGIPAKTTRE